ncbi:site-specific integrase [Alistipes sp. kh20]|uniref:tyrosine-type recombinase/integrase n=2 Tax=Rikenellaceae TaxID=171550 RepID=UPI00189A507E|nr:MULTISPECIES: site-specific integrase [Alistipes]MBS4766772.1 site-specific integrase [Alistipes montrealensis]
MTHSPDLVGTSRRTYMGQTLFAGRSRNKTGPDFMSCFALHIAEYERTGRIGSTANYQMAYRMLTRYLGGSKLYPEQFTAEWLERYERWLLARGLGTNTIVFHLRYLRAVYNRAIESGLFPATSGNPFYRKRIKQVATRKRALPRETLRRIYDADLSAMHPKYALARDLFMFSFYTRGMSFVDMIYLRKCDISDGVLTYKRKKTGQMLSLRIEAPLQEIIDRYDSDSLYVLPVLNGDDSYRAYRQQQRELNKFIRKIGELLEISEPLTFYVARHSWATLARDCGTPLTIISAGMGHTSERTTRVYLAQLDHNVIDRANRKIINL